MPDLTLAPLAREDGKEIGRFTQKTWGVPQRDSYLGGLAAIFERLRTGEIAGRARPDIRDRLRCQNVHRHTLRSRH